MSEVNTPFIITGRKNRLNNIQCMSFVVFLFALPVFLSIFYFFDINETGVFLQEDVYNAVVDCSGIIGLSLYTFMVCAGTKFPYLERVFGLPKLMKTHRWV
jgi:predicted ferric reductase